MILQSAKDYLASANSVKIAHLVSIELPGTDSVYAYLTDYMTNIAYKGSTYQSGRVLGVSTLRLVQGVQNYTMQVSIAGEFSDELNRAISDLSYEGREIIIYKAYLDPNGDIIPFDAVTNGPELLFTGKITSISVAEDYAKGSSIITWECAGLLHDFEKVNGRLTDDTAHRGLVSDGATTLPIPSSGAKKEAYKTDTGFQHANQTISANISYLGKQKEYYLKKSWGGIKTKLREREVVVQRELELKTSLEARFLPVVYGVRRIPGIPVFLDVLSSDPSTMYCVYAFCEGEIEAFLNLYIDGVPAICTNAEAAQTTGVCMGNAQAGDTLSLYLDSSRGPERQENWERFPYDTDDSNVDSAADVVTPASSTTGTIHGCKFNILGEKGAIECQFFHGKSAQAPCEDLVAIAAAQGFMLQNQLKKLDGSSWGPEYWAPASPGVSGSALLDTAYVVAKFKISEDRTEIPTLEAVVSGKLPPVRSAYNTTTLTYTLNPVWHLLDYITNPTYGGGIDLATQIDLESFNAVATQLNATDTSYQTNYITWWRYIGWKPSQYSRAIMQCNTLIQTENAVTKNVEEILSQFKGTLNVLGGRYTLSIEDNSAPQASITMGDVIGRVSVQNVANKDKWNSIQASIVDPAMDWSTNQITFFNSTYLTEDNGIRKKGQAAFSQITNYYTARAWAERTLNQSRAGRTLKMSLHYKYQFLTPNMVVSFTYPRFGYNNTSMRVTEVEVAPNGLVQVSLEKFNPAGYTSSPQPEIGNPSGGGGIPSPKNLTFDTLPNENIPINLDGDTTVYGILHWDKSELSNLMYYLGYYSMVGSDEKVYFEVPPGTEIQISSATKAYQLIRNLTPNVEYIFKVQTVNTSGQKSPYSVYRYNSPEDLEPSILPEVEDFRVTNLAPDNTFIGSSVFLSWTPRTETYIAGYELVLKDSVSGTTILTQQLGKPTSTFEFSIDINMAAYASLNSSSIGAYRSIIATIRTQGFSGAKSIGVSL